MKYFYLTAAIIAAANFSHAAIFTVTRPEAANLPGSLSWAIGEANDTPEADSIHFAIGNGPVTVYMPISMYIHTPITIDGTTQPGYAGKPIVSIQRPNGPDTFQLSFNGLASNSVVRGLAFNGVSSRGMIGVFTNSITIENCWLGTTADLDILGSAPAGIVCGSLYLNVANTTIDNCVIANSHTGIKLIQAVDTDILDSYIGTDPAGVAQFPVHGTGISIRDSTGTYIGPAPAGNGNIITNCGAAGIDTIDSNDTVISQNRIFNNLGIAIDLEMDGSIKSNDGSDLDVPGGGQQNYPELSDVQRINGTVRVEGKLVSTPDTTFVVEIFASENSGLADEGEGQYKIGVFNTITDSDGLANFSEVLPDSLPKGISLYYSATATREDGSWGTSEISPAVFASIDLLFEGKNLDTDPGWIPSGIDSGPEYPLDPTSPDDVDLVTESGMLGVQVHASTTRNRVAGWRNPSLMSLPVHQSSVSQFVRGKFYIYASNPMDAPLNTVPNFRIRLENEGAVLASNTYQYANTGRTSPPYEPYYALLNNEDIEERAGASLRPNDNPLKPSLYRVDFSPPINAASGGTNIGATFEVMSMEDPADGMLALTEIQLSTYAVTSFNPLMSSFQSDDIATAVGLPTSTSLVASSGMFNVEADFQAGRRQELDLAGEVPGSELAVVQESETGTLLDTDQVPADRGGIAVYSVSAPNNVTAPRLEENKLYIGMFIASSDMSASSTNPSEEVQGGFSFQLQTAGGALTSRLEYVGPAALGGAPGSAARALLEAGLPGKDSQNWYSPQMPFPSGEHGGVYVCVMSSPISQDIRPETPGDLGPLADEPGPGVNAPSFRDITIGVNALQQPTSLRINANTVIPWAPPNRAKIRVGGMIIGVKDDIYDGGYGY